MDRARGIIYRKAVTLLELLLAISLLSVIVLAVSSVHLFSHSQVISAERRSRLQNEAAYCLEHMAKDISRAIGNTNDLAVIGYTDNKGIRIRVDDNPADGKIDTTDHWVSYRHENIIQGGSAVDSEIRYYQDAGEGETPSGTYESICQKVKITPIGSTNPDEWGVVFDFDLTKNNYLNVIIRTCWDPSEKSSQCATRDNPLNTMSNNISMPSVSVN